MIIIQHVWDFKVGFKKTKLHKQSNCYMNTIRLGFLRIHVCNKQMSYFIEDNIYANLPMKAES